MVGKGKYEEYRSGLLNIIRLTNKENSILINFSIAGDTCKNVVSFIQQNGTKDVLRDSVFVCDDEFFKDFLERFIEDYYSNMIIAFNDSIDLNADGKYTYRIVTDNNDMLSIDGISLDYANYLVDFTKKIIDNNDIMASCDNDDGVTTAVAALILVVGIGLSFFFMTLFLS